MGGAGAYEGEGEERGWDVLETKQKMCVHRYVCVCVCVCGLLFPFLNVLLVLVLGFCFVYYLERDDM